MPLSFDPETSVTEQTCQDCGTAYVLIKGFIYDDGNAHAIYFAALHHHAAQREARLDVILGSFGDDRAPDHETFGCRVGPVEGQDQPAATLVQAAEPYGNTAIWGRKLDRTAAVVHPRLPDFWAIVDFLLVEHHLINAHVYGLVDPPKAHHP